MDLQVKTRIIILTLSLLVFGKSYPQEINNVQFKLDSENKEVHITYDLYDPKEGANEVMVQASNDQGKTWDLLPSPKLLFGDIHAFKPGKGKSIVWKAGDDYQGFSAELFQ